MTINLTQNEPMQLINLISDMFPKTDLSLIKNAMTGLIITTDSLKITKTIGKDSVSINVTISAS